MIDKRRSTTIPLAAVVVFFLVLPLFSQSPYLLNILIMTGLYIILATTNRLILRTGTWFLGHIAFYAVGAYTVLLARQYLGISYWLALPLAGVMAGLVALGLGYATARVKGVPFCIITVAFVEVVRLTIVKLGGGRPVKCPPPDSLFGLTFDDKIPYFYLIFFLVALTIFVLHMVERSRVGEAIIATAESESLAESIGINTVRYRVLIMVLCCSFAGLAGGFFAPYVRVVGYSTFTLTASIVILIYVVVGGSRSLWGAVIGAAFLNILPEFLPGRASIQNIIYASIVLASLFFLPGGLITLPQVIRQRRIVTLPQVIKEKIASRSKKTKGAP